MLNRTFIRPIVYINADKMSNLTNDFRSLSVVSLENKDYQPSCQNCWHICYLIIKISLRCNPGVWIQIVDWKNNADPKSGSDIYDQSRSGSRYLKNYNPDPDCGLKI